MKTLKKVLSLVLVVAMIASMLIVGAAATEETYYPEAVAVVTGLGIIEGDENGMNFEGNVTREQAAKIIAYLLLGAETADALKTTTAPFADVAASRWSAGYIAYLKGQGIISGVSDTEFDPTANVTGIAFAKMLLTAVGYGKAGEFEGAAWDINTITLANQLGVYTGTVAADLAAAATREDAMLYAFNTLAYVPTVNYNKTFESYYVGTSPLQNVANPAEYTLGALNYDLEKIPGAGSDDFGRPSASWVADGVTLAADIACETPDYVLYGSVNSGTLYDTLGKTIVNTVNEDGLFDEFTVYENGALAATQVTTPIAAGYYTNSIASSGAISEIYVDFVNGAYDITIVTYYEQIGKVTKVDAAKNTLTIGGSIVVDGDIFDITGIAKNEYVVYTMGATAVSAIREAAPVVGTYTGTDFMSQAVIDGVGIGFSKYAKNAIADLELNTAYEFYYDAQGKILMAVEYDDAAATNNYQYLYVNYAESQAAAGGILNGKDAKVVLGVVYPNGGADVLNYAIKYKAATNEYYITLPDGTNKVVDNSGMINEGWYAYTTNENGDVTLKDLNSTYAEEEASLVANTNKAAVSIGGTTYTANSKTVLTLVDLYGNTVSYTGIANFPAINAAYPTLVTHANGSALAKTITAYSDVALSTAATYGYCVMLWSTDANGYTYFFYVDGAPVFITLENTLATSDFDQGTGYVYELSSTNGVYEATKITVTNELNKNFDLNTYVYNYVENAIIDVVDDNYFTTLAVSAEDYADSQYAIWYQTWSQYIPGLEAGQLSSMLYYYDADTIIYDCVNGGIVTELTEGAAFLAKVDTTTTTWAGENYCEIIWIVG